MGRAVDGYNTGFMLESGRIIVGDPMPYENVEGTYIEIDNILTGKWRHMAVFRGPYIDFIVIRPWGNDYKVKEEAVYSIRSESGYVGIFDEAYFINDGSNEEYTDTIIEICENKTTGYLTGGAVAKPNYATSGEYAVYVRRNYSGEVVEVEVTFTDNLHEIMYD